MAMARCWRIIRLPMSDRICNAEIMETIACKSDAVRQKRYINDIVLNLEK
jgi:hypothetical protein